MAFLRQFLGAPPSAFLTSALTLLRRRRPIVGAARVTLALLAPSMGAFVLGCASAPPCRCTCPTCPAFAAAPQEPAAPAPAAVEASRIATASPQSKTRAGETLTEQQLLQLYEGKPARRTLKGKATYYANSLAGRKTASGERYDPAVFTAAHRTLPFGTVVRVVRTDTNKYVYVRITDRGPFAGGGRIIDLSYVAAQRLGMIRAGVVPVRVEVLN